MSARYYKISLNDLYMLKAKNGTGHWCLVHNGISVGRSVFSDPSRYGDYEEVFPEWAKEERIEEVSEVNLIREALDGQRGADQQRLAEYGVKVVSTLIRKNQDYGGSAWKRPELADHLSPGDAILVRLSDKLARLKQLLRSNKAEVAESIEDTLLDAAGYFILLVAKPEESNA